MGFTEQDFGEMLKMKIDGATYKEISEKYYCSIVTIINVFKKHNMAVDWLKLKRIKVVKDWNDGMSTAEICQKYKFSCQSGALAYISNCRRLYNMEVIKRHDPELMNQKYDNLMNDKAAGMTRSELAEKYNLKSVDGVTRMINRIKKKLIQSEMVTAGCIRQSSEDCG